MSFSDPRFAAAVNDDNSARGLLVDLHQRILNCRDSTTLAQLLGKYVAAAAARQSLLAPITPKIIGSITMPSKLQMESRKFTVISNICKTAHDVATSSINNMKA